MNKLANDFLNNMMAHYKAMSPGAQLGTDMGAGALGGAALLGGGGALMSDEKDPEVKRRNLINNLMIGAGTGAAAGGLGYAGTHMEDVTGAPDPMTNHPIYKMIRGLTGNHGDNAAVAGGAVAARDLARDRAVSGKSLNPFADASKHPNAAPDSGDFTKPEDVAKWKKYVTSMREASGGKFTPHARDLIAAHFPKPPGGHESAQTQWLDTQDQIFGANNNASAGGASIRGSDPEAWGVKNPWVDQIMNKLTGGRLGKNPDMYYALKNGVPVGNYSMMNRLGRGGMRAGGAALGMYGLSRATDATLGRGLDSLMSEGDWSKYNDERMQGMPKE